MESSLADGGAAEQETGIQVNLDAEDGKAVTRQRTRTTTRPPGVKDWAAERAETSKEVKRRMARLTNRFNQQLADQQAEHQRQLADLNAKFDRINVKQDTTDTDEAKHQLAMDKLQASLEEAQERGDSKEVARLTREMSSLDARFWAAKTAKATGTPAKVETPAANGGVQPPSQARKPTAAGLAWAKANAEWWNDTADDTAIDAREYANRIHKRRLDEGDGDPESPEYFEEIGALVRKRFPEIEVKSTVKKRRTDGIGPGDDEDDDDEDDTVQHRNPRRAAPSLPNRG